MRPKKEKEILEEKEENLTSFWILKIRKNLYATGVLERSHHKYSNTILEKKIKGKQFRHFQILFIIAIS